MNKTFWFNNQKIRLNSEKYYEYFGYKAYHISPLMYLIINPDHLEVNDQLLSEYILNHKEELDIQNSNGATALIIACLESKENIVKMLINAGCNINLQDKYGNTALIYKSYFTDDNENIFKLLINAGADLNIQNGRHTTALMMALFKYKENIAKILIDAGCKLNLFNSSGNTALMIACIQKNVTMVKMLIKADADLNLVDCNGRTALMIAYINYNHEIIVTLLDAGADTSIIDRDKYSCLMMMINSTHIISKHTIEKSIDIINLNLVNNHLHVPNLKHLLSFKQVSGFEYICKYFKNEYIEYCFNTKTYNELTLIKCILISNHQKYLISLLSKLYLNKLIYFTVYQN